MNIKEVLRQWAETDEHKAKAEETRQIIAKALTTHQKPYVAFSGGKDSTCMLHLVLQQKPDIMVYHWDYGPYLMPRDVEKEVIEIAKKIGTQNLVVDTSRLYTSREATGIWYREFFGRVIKELCQQGYDLVFVGIRKHESLKRKRRVERGKKLTVIDECWPLQNWTWQDVWAYIFSNNLPYHSVYDKYAPIVGWDNARFVTFFDPEFDKIGASNLDGVLMWRWRNMKG